MKKLILNISLTFIMLILSTKVYAYKSYKIGDVITYNDIDFYVIKDSGSDSDYVVLLKADPFTISEMNSYNQNVERDCYYYYSPQVESYRNLFGTMRFYESTSCGYNCDQHWVTSGCTNDYNKSNVKIVVDAWSEDKFDRNILKNVRLITLDDLKELGYEYKSTCATCQEWVKTSKTPKWLITARYGLGSFLTMIPVEGRSDYVYTVAEHDLSGFGNSGYIRPVVELYKSALGDTKEYKDEDLSGEITEQNKVKIYNTYEFGDKVTYNGMDFYVIKESDKYSNYVTLLKEKPLLTSEVSNYGNNHVNRYVKDSLGVVLDVDGFGNIAYYSREKCSNINYNIKKGCSSDYNRSDVKYVVDAWTLDMFDKSKLVSDELGYKTRLITYDELINIGLNISQKVTDDTFEISEGVPTWLYSFSYFWTMSPYYDSTEEVWIGRNGVEEQQVYNAYATIRPVINLKKESIGYETINEDGKIDYKKVDDKKNNNQVSVPNTVKKVSIIFIILGVVALTISVIVFIIKRKK